MKTKSAAPTSGARRRLYPPPPGHDADCPKAPCAGVIFGFDAQGDLSICDLETIRQIYFPHRQTLKAQDIRALIEGPSPGGERHIGFIGAQRPGKASVDQLSALIRVIGYFLLFLLKRRDLNDKLKEQSYLDPMTGAFNRAALDNFFAEHVDGRGHTMGLVYGDISSLKQVNDAYGHAAGDELILQCYRLLSTSMDGDPVFRIGGDEFVVACLDASKSDFEHKVAKLYRQIASQPYHLAIGSAWTDVLPSSFDDLLKQADKQMYEDKQAYYDTCDESTKQIRDRRKPPEAKPLQLSYDTLPTLMTNKHGCYLCIGDQMGQRYFISDSLKEKFGFSSNRVDDFWDQWSRRIISDDHKRHFRRIIAETLREKKTHVDFVFDMQDLRGNVVTSRGSGLIQWNEDLSEPILFMSCMQIDENVHALDPVTGLPTSRSALEAVKNLTVPSDVLLFELNAWDKINALRGIEFGNHLVKGIAEQLQTRFSGKETVNFFRMRDTKFMALFSRPRQTHRERAEAIRGIVGKAYAAHKIVSRIPVTFLPVERSAQTGEPVDSVQTVETFLMQAQTADKAHQVRHAAHYLDELRQEIDMESALTRDVHGGMNNFRIVVQPVVSAETRRIRFAEVLLRWDYHGQEVLPSIFVPILERENLMDIAGKWLLEQTVSLCRRLAERRCEISVAFNVSCRQIFGADLAETIRSELNKHGLSGSSVFAKLTQPQDAAAANDMQRFIDACDEAGIGIALDDFGSQYRTVGLLLKYSAQVITLNRSHLKAMTASEKELQLARSLVRSCRKIGKTVCIVGVETEEELAAAMQTGCDWIQGFYFYKPMPVDELLEVLDKDAAGN